jgi:hypothetical protein
VAWMVAGFGARVARSAKTPTGARVARSARTPFWVSGVAGGAARAIRVARLDRVARRVVAAEMAE